MRYVPLAVVATCYAALAALDANAIEIQQDVRTAILLFGAAAVAKLGWSRAAGKPSA